MAEGTMGKKSEAKKNKASKQDGAKKKNGSAKASRQYSDILYEVKDQVAWVTINRPRVHNAFREQTLDEMIDALKSTRDDPSIACAVITGAGRQGVLRRRRFLRHEAAHLHQRRHVERPHAGPRHDDPRAADPGDRHGQRLVHGRRPRARAVVRPRDRVGECGARADRRRGRRLPDGRRDAIPAAHHRRAARARDDLPAPGASPPRRRCRSA